MDVTALVAVTQGLKEIRGLIKSARPDPVLAEAQERLLELGEIALKAREEIDDLARENRELRAQLELKGKTRFEKNLRWSADEPDHPYCAACWESDGKAVHVTRLRGHSYRCPACKQDFYTRDRGSAASVGRGSRGKLLLGDPEF